MLMVRGFFLCPLRSFQLFLFILELDVTVDADFFFFVFEGCNEIIFNPLIKWWRYGPISRQLRTFVWSNAPIHYKIGMMSCTWMQFFFCRV